MTTLPKPFIVYALPRSRTYWLSQFFSYGGWECLHDICVDARSIAEIQQLLKRPRGGVVDTGLVEGWRLVKRFMPEAKVAVIRRPVDEVCSSLSKFGIGNSPALKASMQERDRMLDEVSAQPGVFTAYFHDLDKELVIKGLFEHCLELPFDRDWWMTQKGQNLQIDMTARIQKLLRIPPRSRR